MELSEEDFLRLINRLLERLHQTDGDNESSHFSFNYIAPGAQYVNSIGTQILSSDKHQEAQQDNSIKEIPPDLPETLATTKALELWQKAMDEEWVDDKFQPKVSRTKAALMADRMATILNIKQKWKTFEVFWHRSNMRSDYNNALSQRQAYKFQEKLKTTLT